MRYASIRDMDISNGKGIGIALFVQGCPGPHCPGCFNKTSWNFDDGREWTSETEDLLIEYLSMPYIDRLSILGGEPLCLQNIETVSHIINTVKNLYPNKRIWCYTGYKWEELNKEYIKNCDVIVDGKYIKELRDLTLAFRGSKNQRLINVQESLKQGVTVEYGI